MLAQVEKCWTWGVRASLGCWGVNAAEYLELCGGRPSGQPALATDGPAYVAPTPLGSYVRDVEDHEGAGCQAGKSDQGPRGDPKKGSNDEEEEGE